MLTEHGCQIAPATYCAARKRQSEPSARTVRDAELKEQIKEVYETNYRFYGARKIWCQPNRQGQKVARCTVERPMRELGIAGAVRGKRVITTMPDPAATRAPDLLDREFVAPAPNRTWVADFTHVAAWAGVISRSSWIRSPAASSGWSASMSKQTQLVLDAVDMGLWQRDRDGLSPALGELVHHSDAGSQGGFNRSSQHLDREVKRWVSWSTRSGCVRIAGRFRRRVGRRWPGVRTGSSSGRRLPVVSRPRTRVWRPVCPRRWGSAGSGTLAV
ncbi:IS3 family transposase [Streptomyces sp. NPDC056230]|uniref:IS3 family transposase n=1 Tax=Streptomyces sp. NPDC056230 TaxID=3345754 RepID=UPI0035DC2B0A